MDGHADVVGVVERRVTAVDSDPYEHLEVFGPRPFSKLTLDCHRRVKGGSGSFEHREEIVGPSFDHVAEHFQRRAS